MFEQMAEDVRALARVYALVMASGQFFSHLTAAILWGLPIPPSFFLAGNGGIPQTKLLDVSVFAPARTPRAAGIRGHQMPAAYASVRLRDGVRVASPASTWAMLGGVFTDVRDIVALGDAVVRVPMFKDDPPALATIAELAAAVAAGRRRGIALLREALPLIRTRSASRMETLCRLTLVAAGLPEPLLNHDVRVRGILLACVDLAYPDLRIAIEYEGEQHLTDPEQWAKDIERHARLVDHGWIVIRVTKGELDDPARLIARIRRAIATRS